MKPTKENIIGALDPDQIRCHFCNEYFSKKTASDIIIDDSGIDKPVCPFCIDKHSNVNKREDDAIHETNPDMEFCDVCEEFRQIDPDWIERREALIDDNPELKSWLIASEIEAFCEGCEDEVMESSKQC